MVGFHDQPVRSPAFYHPDLPPTLKPLVPCYLLTKFIKGIIVCQGMGNGVLFQTIKH